MNDGAQVLARLPYHSTQPHRLTVASEVATLDLVRLQGMPVPTVLHYSTNSDNSVGAEFMTMQKLPDRALGEEWFTLSEKQRLKILLQVVEMEARLAQVDLPAYGSIFYRKDLPADGAGVTIPSTAGDQEYCIGPDVSLQWWYRERASLEVKCGPSAGIPQYFQNYWDDESVRYFRPPILPPNLADLDDEAQAEAQELYRRRQLHYFYLSFTKSHNPTHYEVLDRGTDLLTRKTFSHAGAPWEGNNVPLHADLIHLSELWLQIIKNNGHVQEAHSPPLLFSASDRECTMKAHTDQEETDSQLQTIRDAIGITSEGWTSHEYYENAVQQAEMLKRHAIDSLDTEEEKQMTLAYWPFDDYDEDT